MLTRVVLAAERASLARQLGQVLKRDDVLLETVKGTRRLWERISRKSADMIVLGQSVIPEPQTEMISVLRGLPDSPTVVVVSEKDNAEQRARLLAAGCDAVLTEKLSAKALRDVFGALIQKISDRRLQETRDIGKPQLSDFVSESPAMQAFMHVVERVATSNTSLLILGETGVGKERLARAIHAEGPRAGGPFIAVNCGALPESLMESELFGHEKGAFTGASRARRGWFELAHRGTVFLDEIGDMPLHLQVKLLRVIQEREVRPIGSERSIGIDVRLMAASNRDLEEEVEGGNFRRDLYYRLSVVTLTIPPLRERREDIPVLVDSYVDYLQPMIGCQVGGITEEAREALTRYSWPGNVRELVNVIERALLLCDRRKITLNDLPEGIRAQASEKGQLESVEKDASMFRAEWLERPWSEVREEALAGLECSYLSALLEATEGRVGETAARAGIQPRSLYEKMKRHGLRKEDFRITQQEG